MLPILFNIFVLYAVVFVVANISMLAPYVDYATQLDAMRNLFIFISWCLTMRYLVNPARVSWIIILYSLCILVLIMYYTLSNLASLHSIIPENDIFVIDMQQVHYFKMLMIWFDTLAFFLVIHLLEHRREHVVL